MTNDWIRRRHFLSTLFISTLMVNLLALPRTQASDEDSGLAAYDPDRLGSYSARIEWQVAHHSGNQTTVCRNDGSAVFLGSDVFLTASHLVDQNPVTDGCADLAVAHPLIEFGSARLAAKVIAVGGWMDVEGKLAYPDGRDLAIVTVDRRMIPPELRSEVPFWICTTDPPERAVVRIATEYGLYAASIVPRISDEFARIDFVPKHGDSGGGIFDPVRRCLVGIISNGDSYGTNYVPNEAVRRFLRAAGLRNGKSPTGRSSSGLPPGDHEAPIFQ